MAELIAFDYKWIMLVLILAYGILGGLVTLFITRKGSGIETNWRRWSDSVREIDTPPDEIEQIEETKEGSWIKNQFRGVKGIFLWYMVVFAAMFVFSLIPTLSTIYHLDNDFDNKMDSADIYVYESEGEYVLTIASEGKIEDSQIESNLGSENYDEDNIVIEFPIYDFLYSSEDMDNIKAELETDDIVKITDENMISKTKATYMIGISYALMTLYSASTAVFLCMFMLGFSFLLLILLTMMIILLFTKRKNRHNDKEQRHKVIEEKEQFFENLISGRVAWILVRILMIFPIVSQGLLIISMPFVFLVAITFIPALLVSMIIISVIILTGYLINWEEREINHKEGNGWKTNKKVKSDKVETDSHSEQSKEKEE